MSSKNSAKNFIIFIFAVTSIFTLLFDLLRVDLTVIEHHENGFDFLLFESAFLDSQFSWAITLIGSIAILQLGLSVLSIWLTIKSLINDGKTNLHIGVILISFLVSITYMIEGFVLRKHFITQYIDNVSSNIYLDMFDIIYIERHITTTAFVPFIIHCILSLFFILIHFSAVNTTIPSSTKQNINPTTPVPKKYYQVDELKKCKALFDAGIITQEEFEKKKHDILNK